MTTLYAPILKIDEEQRMCFGYASTETRDDQGEIIRRAAIEAALPEYMRFANIREMHQPSAVGVAKEAAMDATGLWLGAFVADDRAWAKVKAGVYRGFSIGGRVTSRDIADKTIVTGLELTEISLVDRPANPDSVYQIVKRMSGQLRQTGPTTAAHHRALAEESHGRALDASNKRKRAREIAQRHAGLAVRALAEGDVDLHHRHESLCGAGNRLADTFSELERHHRALAAHHRAMARETEPSDVEKAEIFFGRFSRR